LQDRFGEPLVPVQFVTNSAEGYLYVPSSGSIYKLDSNDQGTPVADYGVIMMFQDQFDRNVVMVYGLGTDGTLGACQVLSECNDWSLHGSAVVVKSYPNKLGNFPSNSSIVEVVY
jgi:hypothetical protein